MNPKKRLSNPFSTGGGGANFEGHVQASFVTLMLTGGYAPCLPCWPIKNIKLQGKVDGFDTDDLIVFVENPKDGEQRKLLGQIKHSISITEGSGIFGEVIQAAWSDYNNSSLFKSGRDVICLISVALRKTDCEAAWLLNHARANPHDHARFFRNVLTANFSSKAKQDKLKAFRHHLKNANGGVELDDEATHGFLKNFYLLGYDLGEEDGVVLSLINSHISQFNSDTPRFVWSRILEFTNNRNHHAGHIAREDIPEDLEQIFITQPAQHMPESLKKPEIVSTDWAQHQDSIYLALAYLAGGWNESKQCDQDIISELLGIRYDQWLQKAGDVLKFPDSPLSVKNGVWKVSNRLDLWNALAPRLLDQHLELFKTLAVRVLKIIDPAFELPVEERYAASIHGKVMPCSSVLREGLAEGLAILGSHPKAASHCSQEKAELTALLALREIFDGADWMLWGSVNNLLPALAEAAPGEFLECVEKALLTKPSLFDELFAQEGNGISGRNYMTGLLWALESLAWDEKYLVRVCVVLAELADHDPGGQWANRPSNSLATILLPWLPQTLASVEKRQTAVRTLLDEFPDVAWKLIVQLLPNQHQTSSGTRKPRWRHVIPDSWEKRVTNDEYWRLSAFYAELAVQASHKEIDRLCLLIDQFDHLPEAAFNQLTDILSSEDITSLPDDEKNKLWNRLKKLTARHRRFSDKEWALPNELLSRLELLSEALAPEEPTVLYQRLFSDRDFDFYEEVGNWQEQREKLDRQRESAIRDIFSKEGIDGVIQFSESIMSTHQVGQALAAIEDNSIDRRLLPNFLSTENHKHKSLVGSFIWRKHYLQEWGWSDNLDKSQWTPEQIGQFLAHLPFAKETWDRASVLLGENEAEYWSRVEGNAHSAGEFIVEGIEKLLEHRRPYAAINCLSVMLLNKQAVDSDLCVRALLRALSSQEPSHAMDQYQVTELIQLLQNDHAVDPDALFRVEWAYLPLLNRYSGAEPKFLEHKLANDAEFFCELIQLTYRPKKEEETQKEATEQEKSIATNAWRLLHHAKIVPGTQRDGTFNAENFKAWLQQVKDRCKNSGRLDVALGHVGEILIHAPPEDDLWIHRSVAAALNDRDADAMRDGFRSGIYNARGAHMVDPSGAPERALAEKYRAQAEDVENAGFYRLAVTLREVADGYDRQAQRNIDEYGDMR